VTVLRLGTRGSQLALAQAEFVAHLLRERGHEVEVVKIQTTGDRLQGTDHDSSNKALWVQEIEEALLESSIDLAVHSAKDMPAVLADGLTVGAYPDREDPRDCFIGAPGRRFTALPPGSRVGTSSARRTALLRALRPELEVVPVRGNVTTRLEKIEALGLDGIVVASAGLIRLGLEDRILDPLDQERYVPAGGQGALAVEVRIDDDRVQKIVTQIEDPMVAAQVRAERALLAELGGDCKTPIGVHASLQGLRLMLRALVLSPSGLARIEGSAEGDIEAPETLGVTLGRELVQRGAGRLIERLE
jgi:hydroxymethylbilane synthase